LIPHIRTLCDHVIKKTQGLRFPKGSSTGSRTFVTAKIRFPNKYWKNYYIQLQNLVKNYRLAC